MAKLDALDKDSKHFFQSDRMIRRQLRETEAKLGIHPDPCGGCKGKGSTGHPPVTCHLCHGRGWR
jgi:hypothetical protein